MDAGEAAITEPKSAETRVSCQVTPMKKRPEESVTPLGIDAAVVLVLYGRDIRLWGGRSFLVIAPVPHGQGHICGLKGRRGVLDGASSIANRPTTQPAT
jgi:hypothetical protein